MELDEMHPAVSQPSINEEAEASAPTPRTIIGKKALWSLCLQHFSSQWGSRSMEFAMYLYLSQLYPLSLLPASIFGFFSTGSAILGAGFIGNFIDATPRLRAVKLCIVLQKVSAGTAYALFLLLFLELRRQAEDALETSQALVWFLFSLIVVDGMVLNLATIAINVAVERDWVSTIAEKDPETLTMLNAYLRRIDLICKLVAPLFVSLLSTAVSYPFSIAFLLGYSVVTLFTEFFWIQLVYKNLPILGTEESERRARAALEAQPLSDPTPTPNTFAARVAKLRKKVKPTARQMASDWKEFVLNPIFPSSLAISLLYLTVLSFDGTMLTWLNSHSYSDSFVAGMRGICVVTGLFGTVLMPWLERRIGVVRTGSWSIISEVLSLIPVLLSFFIGAAPEGKRSVPWNAAILFTGMALSRIGLWSFDLCQLKELQTVLHDHPRRNSITALQSSLQNVLDLLKYILTMVLSRPSQFKWAAVVSFASVVGGAGSYLWYVKKERGHVFHLDWTEHLLKKKT
ncbi:hypothetical protein MNV49_002927 [Pseudohyphozyma bogoriensis]|nr:hypothetical protein MNV49_002927 [Pseudohyphozyma bogoriensis]